MVERGDAEDTHSEPATPQDPSTPKPEEKIKIIKYLIDLNLLFWEAGESRFSHKKKISTIQCAEVWRVSKRTALRRIEEIEKFGYIVAVHGVGVFLTENGVEILEEYKIEQEKERYKTDIEQAISKIIDAKTEEVLELTKKYPEEKSLFLDIPKDIQGNLYDALIENPLHIIKTFEKILNEKSYPSHVEELKLNIRFNYPSYLAKKIRDITADDVNKFIGVKGIITRVSDVFFKPKIAVFQCPFCGSFKNIEQKYNVVPVYPYSCDNCKKPVNFKYRVEESELINLQTIEIQEDIEDYETETRKIKVYLLDDLTTKNISVGSKVFISGILGVSLLEKNLLFKKYILANNISLVEEEKIIFNNDDITRFKEFSKDRPLEKIINILAPSIKGLDMVKKAIALQFFSSPHQFVDYDGMGGRFNIHILLIGDPATGKTNLLLSACDIAPKGLFVSAEGATGRGLTVSVERTNTEFGETWEVRAGAMVLANGGGLYLDEIDKAVKGKDIVEKMHQAMETGTVSIARASVVGTYKADTYILSASNPKYGRFAPEKSIVEQIDLPNTLLSRFDLIFPIRDIPDEKKDKEIAEGIQNIFLGEKTDYNDIKSFVKKYISYAREIEVKIPKENAKTIEEYYLYLRRVSSQNQIQITPRQMHAIYRLAIASAKSRLSNVVEKEDVMTAIELLEYSLKQIAKDEKTGFFDIDKITIGTKDEREKIRKMSDILEGMLDDKKQCSKEKFIAECITQGLTKNDVLTFISNMKREGRLVEHPKEIIERII